MTESGEFSKFEVLGALPHHGSDHVCQRHPASHRAGLPGSVGNDVDHDEEGEEGSTSFQGF